jgi:hypothetical protein
MVVQRVFNYLQAGREGWDMDRKAAGGKRGGREGAQKGSLGYFRINSTLCQARHCSPIPSMTGKDNF